MPAMAAHCGQLERCLVCSVRTRNGLCGALFGDVGQQAANLQRISAPIAQSNKFARRRRTIYRANEPSNSVAIIYDGWACAYIQLPKGNRQILSFLLPGDITSAAAVFEERSEVSIEAITDVQYCVIDKRQLSEVLRTKRDVFDTFSKLWARRKNEIENLAADLGHRTADERIARLILALYRRHADLDMVHDGQFPFPLRLQHIADATGLTVVHASRVICSMRRVGLIELEGRSLTVRDLPELQNIGSA
jgi:CRP/FNR family transcriptional regulator, anaerobic regulatory protein